MDKINIHTLSASRRPKATANPLPQLLQTPSGLALLELQGTINLPAQDDEDDITATDIHDGIVSQETPIGRLIFPEYDAAKPEDTKWMKQVYLYVGQHQRLTGEVKKLPKAIAVIRKKKVGGVREREEGGMEGVEGEKADELEIVEIVKHKILFSTRPEPVGAKVVGE